MSKICFLSADNLSSWLATAAASRQVLAPRREGRSVVFRPLSPGATPVLARATIAPKGAVFPHSETLFAYTGKKDPENPAKITLTLDDSHDAPAQMLFGCRSCDARGFLALDQAYLKGRFVDPYYKARREKLLIITQTCDTPAASCFCHWTGGGPASPEGSDILMTEVAGGFVLEAVSEKGEAFLNTEAKLPDGADKMAEAQAKREKAAAMQDPAPDISAAAKRLEQRFTDMAFWTAQTAKCLSCGACTYMCPTCQCFTITDEGDSLGGRRIRSWDSCMSPLFTKETSGHNPRLDKAMRMRNRVSHKYWYAPGYSDGRLSCTGCGRCVRQCPAALDIREIVLKAIAE